MIKEGIMKKCLLYAGMVFLSNGLYAMDDNQEDWILVDDPSKVFQDNSKKKKDQSIRHHISLPPKKKISKQVKRLSKVSIVCGS